MTTRPTPATLAGIVSISTVEGYCARPPGTYTAADATGATLTPSSVPSARVVNQDCSRSRSWKSRIWSRARESAERNSGGTSSSAPATRSSGTRKSRGQAPSKRRQ